MDGDAFSAAVLEKLPLADAVWRLLHFTMDDLWLDDLWRRKRGPCYQRDLKFSILAHLISNALLEHGGSGNQAFERAGNGRSCRSRSPRPTTSWGTSPWPSARHCSRKAPSG